MPSSESPEQFETKDRGGQTLHFNGTVGTTAIDIPPTPGDPIDEIVMENMDTNVAFPRLFISFDGGVTFKTVRLGFNIAWSPKGHITQVKIKASTSLVAYEILLNTSK